MNQKKAVKYLGKVLMILSFAFIIKKLYDYRDSMTECLTPSVFAFMIVCAILYGCLVYTLPGIYKVLLNMTCRTHYNHTKIAEIYCKSQLYKYLPGNVMQYAGRNQFAVDENLSHADVAFATILDITTTIFGSLLATALLSSHYALDYLRASGFSYRRLAVIFLVLIAVVIVFFILGFLFFKKRLLSYLERYLQLITFRNIVKYIILVLYNTFVFILFGILFLGVLAIAGGQLQASLWPVAIGLFCFSYLLGYITPGVPGGIGIREAILSFFFAGWLDPSVIIAGSLIYRIATILGDLVSYGISLLTTALAKKGGHNS